MNKLNHKLQPKKKENKLLRAKKKGKGGRKYSQKIRKTNI